MDIKTQERSGAYKITSIAVTAALVFVITWLIRLPVPVSAGAYLNFGDVVIYIAAFILGGPMGAIAAGVGSLLADLAGGAAVYALPTLIIKGAMAFLVGAIMAKRRKFGFFVLSCILAGAIMVAGYFVFEYLMFGFAYAASALPFNLVQWGGSVAAALALFPVAKRMARLT